MNVKQGDLAIVINSPLGKCIGSIVRVVRRTNMEGVFWLCEFQREVLTLNNNMKTAAAVKDCNLRPVSGIPDTETTDTEQPIDIREPA